VSLVVDGTPAKITGTLALAEGVSPLPWVVLGLVAAGLVVLVGRRHPLRAAPAAVIGWAVLRAPVLWKPVLPTDLPYALDRGLTAAALGLALAAAGLVVWGGGLAVATPHPATASTAAGGGTPAA
jgi:hypothetical protein